MTQCLYAFHGSFPRWYRIFKINTLTQFVDSFSWISNPHCFPAYADKRLTLNFGSHQKALNLGRARGREVQFSTTQTDNASRVAPGSSVGLRLLNNLPFFRTENNPGRVPT